MVKQNHKNSSKQQYELKKLEKLQKRNDQNKLTLMQQKINRELLWCETTLEHFDVAIQQNDKPDIIFDGIKQLFENYKSLIQNGTPVDRAKYILMMNMRMQLEDIFKNQGELSKTKESQLSEPLKNI